MLEGRLKGISEETAEKMASTLTFFDVDIHAFNIHFEKIINSYERIINTIQATKQLQIAIYEAKKVDSWFFKWYYQMKINKLKKQLKI